MIFLKSYLELRLDLEGEKERDNLFICAEIEENKKV